jgi:hypothetical protein
MGEEGRGREFRRIWKWLSMTGVPGKKTIL